VAEVPPLASESQLGETSSEVSPTQQQLQAVQMEFYY